MFGRLASYRAALALLTLTACGGGDDVEDDDPKARAEACDLIGRYRVTSVPPALEGCASWPGAESAIEISGDDALQVEIAGHVLDATVSADCTLEAIGCTTSDAGDYRQLRAVITRGDDALHVALDSDEVRSHFLGACIGAAELEVTREDGSGCAIEGTYDASAGTLEAGDCDLSWSEGTLEITRQGDLYSASWSGTVVDELTLDEATCTLSGTRGRGNEVWIYNNVPRALSIELRKDGTGISGSVTDSLDGETFDGLTCAQGRFALSAARSAGSAAIATTTCGERPTICGDGTCERDETCGSCVADCGCEAGKTCAGAPAQCLTSCRFFEDTCSDGERCDSLTGSSISTYDSLYCVPAGDVANGEHCRMHAECGEGSICARLTSGPSFAIEDDNALGVCARACSDDGSSCDEGDTCAYVQQSSIMACVPTCSADRPCSGPDAFCWMQYTNDTTGKCVAQPSAGIGHALEACDPDAPIGTVQCEGGTGCVGDCLNGVCDNYCAPVCPSAAGCPAEYPNCDVISGTSIGYCRR